jgi:hypothetical protein
VAATAACARYNADMRYSIGQLLFLVALVAVACFVWIAPAIVRVPLLFIAVLIMPGPLVVLLRYGGRRAQSFALGGLAAYVAWLLLGGIPCVVFVSYRFMKGGIPDPSNIRWSIERFVDSYYPGYVGLFAPWIIVPLAGLLSVVVHYLFRDRS